MELTLPLPCKPDLTDLLKINLKAFVERSLHGIWIGYASEKLGVAKNFTTFDHLLPALMTEISFDIWGCRTLTNKYIDKYERLTFERSRQHLKDDIGGVAGLVLGYTLGHYIGTIF